MLPLSALLNSTKKNQNHPHVRDNPVVADWNGDGIDDLIVAHGQSDEVLGFLGGKDGLSKKRVQRIALKYRVHYEHGVFVGDFNGDGKVDLAVFGYTNTGAGGRRLSTSGFSKPRPWQLPIFADGWLSATGARVTSMEFSDETASLVAFLIPEGRKP